MKTVFTIPPDVSFVAALAEGLLAKAGADPFKLAEMLVLLPTRRACRALREEFLRVMGGQATLLPRLQPLGDVDEEELSFAGADDFSIPPAITPLRRQMLLTQLIVKKDSSLPLDQAAQLARALGDLLDQVQVERKDFSGLPALVEGDLAEHWQATVKFLGIVMEEWPKILEDEGCMDPAARRNRVLAAQGEAWRKAPPVVPVVAAGSTGSLPAVAELLDVIAGLPEGLVVLPGLDQALEEEAWQKIEETHPQYGMKKWLELAKVERGDVQVWPQAQSVRGQRSRLLQEALRPAATTEGWLKLSPEALTEKAYAGLSRIEAETQQEEAEVIALRLRAVLEEKNKTAALVTPDRKLAERVVVALRRWGVEADDSAGLSLASLPVGSFLCDVLAAAVPEASPVAYLSFLKHPLASCGCNASVCRERAREVEVAVWRGVRLAHGWQGARKGLKEKGALAAWVGEIENAFEPVTKTWFEKRPLTKRLSEHLALAERMAATDTESGLARLWGDETGEAAAVWLDDFRQAGQGFPDLTGDAYARLFMALLCGVTLRPSRGQHPRLSILGPLEARLLHKDLMILGGLNEGTWPPEAALDPWLSRPMKRKFGLPLPERRLGLSAHDFVQLANAPEALLTRARRVGGTPSVPSRFLLQLEAVLQALGAQGEGRDVLAPSMPWLEWARHLDKPEEGFRPCARPSPRPPLEARPKQLSVTEIGTWQRNPYAIYAKHILKLNKIEDIDARIGAAEYGSIVHAALEAFLKKHKVCWPEKPVEALLAEGRAAFDLFHDRPQVAAFWWSRFERVAAWFVAQEAKRRREGKKVLAVECKGLLPMLEGAFALKGRADRIDELPDGLLEIIDYKTGTVPGKKEIELGYEPQLALLAIMAEAGGFKDLQKAQVGGLSYWKLRGDEEGGKTQTIQSINEVVPAAYKGLERLIKKFADPHTAYEPVPKSKFAARYDDYAHLARLAEWGRLGGEE